MDLNERVSLLLPMGFDRYHSDDPSTNLDFEDTFKSRFRDPEYLLFLGVIDQAVADYKQAYIKKTGNFREVFDWFFNSADRTTVGSFNWICESLHLCKRDYLKRLILWTKEAKRESKNQAN